MQIKFLKAYNGDFIWISFLENERPCNIVIDGGIGDTYQNNLKQTGDLYNVININKRQKTKY